jgi:transposase
MKLDEKNIEKRAKELLRFRNKLFILKFISKSRMSIRAECAAFGIPRNSYYNWKKKYQEEGEVGLRRKKPIAKNHPNQIPRDVIDKILELRKEYQLGSIRITWYLERYHGIKISESSVYRTLARYGVNRLHSSYFR